MNATPEHHHEQPERVHHETNSADTFFAEVSVYAGVLLATAEMVELLHDYFAASDPALRTDLGRYLIARNPDEDTGDPTMETNILLQGLTETAELLHALVRDVGGNDRPPSPAHH